MPDIVGYHMRMRLEVDKVIARDDKERRGLSRIVLTRSPGFKLLVFKAADTHLHLNLAEPEKERCVELCRRISISWGRRYPAKGRLITLPPKPIEDVWHLHNTFGYVLDQEKRHSCEVDRYHEASMLLDLLGLRVTGEHLVELVHHELPRVQWDALIERLGPFDLSRSFTSLDHLAEAAAAALALPDLIGSTRDQVEAKRAAVQVASPCLTTLEIGDLLGVTRRRVVQLQGTLRARPVDESLARAVVLQLRFRCAVNLWLGEQEPERRVWASREGDVAAGGRTAARRRRQSGR